MNNTNSTREVEPEDLKRTTQQDGTLPERAWIKALSTGDLAAYRRDIRAEHHDGRPVAEYVRAAVAGPRGDAATTARNRDEAQKIVIATEYVLGEQFDIAARHELADRITATLDAAASSATPVNPWAKLIGKYKDDPTWQEFDAFLKEHREEIDRAYAESLVAPPESTVAGETAFFWCPACQRKRLGEVEEVTIMCLTCKNVCNVPPGLQINASTSTSDNARRAAEEIVASVSVNDFRQVQRLNRVEGIAAIISKYFAAAPADNDAESLRAKLPSPAQQALQIVTAWRAVVGGDDLLIHYIKQAIEENRATTTKGAR